MILGPISLLDCLVFVICLIPSLLYHAGVFQTLIVVIEILPFFVIQLPYQLVRERYLKRSKDRSPFARNATFFQDIVIRCVRYAFANIPVIIGRVFFSKWVAYPFLRFRMLRHGYLKMPFECHEVDRKGVKGVWVICDSTAEPDIVLYYCHGGGFSMGSSYFYLEFLIAWITRLKDKGFSNPALLALEYTLVPDATWPTQFEETRAGYKFITEYMKIDASRVCLGGDSAGATLILSFLLSNASRSPPSVSESLPGMAVLISPWTHLVSVMNRNTLSDYLDSDALHLYARQYAGNNDVQGDIISPGLNNGQWRKAAPLHGFYITYGAEEVFAPGIQATSGRMKKEGVSPVTVYQEDAGIHAWPVVNLFLCDSREERLKGLDRITDHMVANMLKSKP